MDVEEIYKKIQALFLECNHVWLMCDMIPVLSITKGELPPEKLKVVLGVFIQEGHEYDVVRLI